MGPDKKGLFIEPPKRDVRSGGASVPTLLLTGQSVTPKPLPHNVRERRNLIPMPLKGYSTSGSEEFSVATSCSYLWVSGVYDSA
jgi:hypothetical protein